MAAHVVKTAQHAIFSARYYDRFFTEFDCEELPLLADLIEPPCNLPGMRENAFILQSRDPGIKVPRIRNRRCPLERILRPVQVQE